MGRRRRISKEKKTPFQIIKKITEKADVVIEVIDARMPELTRNKQLEEEITKPLIIVANKVDLISRKALGKLQDYVKVSSIKGQGIGTLIRLIKSKTTWKKPWVAVIGYPNIGKSSLINQLSKGGRARTSSESGFTKGYQYIAGRGNIMLVDSPGIIPFEAHDEVRLGLVAGLSPEKLEDPDIVAEELIKLLKINNPKALGRAYGIDSSKSPEKIILEFGKKRHMLKKGGKIDTRRAAIHILIDWHKGKIKW